VGSRLAFLLDKKGYKVFVADKVAPKERGINFPSSITFSHGNLKDTDFTDKVLKDMHVVVHLAADIGSLTYMQENQAQILTENLAIDSTLYPLMVKNNIEKIVYSSSSMVYQNSPKFPYKEEDLKDVLLPTNTYGFSKLAGEYFCKSYLEQFGLPYVIIRYHNIYGPGEDSKGEKPGDIHVIPALLEKVLKGQYPLELLGNPEATRPFTYVDDAVMASCMIVEETLKDNLEVINTDFNIGPKEATKIIDLARKIWEMFGDRRPFEYVAQKTNAITANKREMDPEKIETIIGWKPEISLEQGLKPTMEWLKNRPGKN